MRALNNTGGIVFFGPANDYQRFLETEKPAGDLVTQIDAAEARQLCATWIETHYPTWRQLNVLRVGEAEEVAAMGAFIDTVRDWSNQDNPSLSDLEAIKPPAR